MSDYNLGIKLDTIINDGLKQVERNVPINTPSTFNWLGHPLEGKLYRNVDTNEITTTFDITDMKLTGAGETYYVSTTGDDANDGLSESAALESIDTAIEKSDALTIMVKAGIYKKYKGFSTAGHTNKKVNIMGYDGEVIISPYDVLVWTLSAGQTYTYEAARSAVSRVIDLKYTDDVGDYEMLTEQTTIADVETNPGSFYSDETNVYVHTKDNRQPDSDIIEPLQTGNGYFLGNTELYLENLKLYGGRPLDVRSNADTDTPKIFAKNCEFKYSTDTFNGAGLQGTALSIFDSCIASKNNYDGFNYHIDNNILPHAIEINCEGRNNGSTTQDNGSTIHDGAKIIRINGKYFDNTGPNVIEVNDNTQSWNLGCVSSYSNIATFDTGETFAIGQTTGRGTMWLDTCIAYGGTIRIGAESKLFQHNSNINDGAVDGVINNY